MGLSFRRVVTGHDERGCAVVTFDGPTETVMSRRPGHESSVVWTTSRVPADNSGDADEARREGLGTSIDEGTVFRIVEYQPGVAGRMHRTDSVDYAIVLSGSIDMELDDGVLVHLKAGDVLVQRGTVHNWICRGPEACRIAFVLIGAEPVKRGGKVLHAHG